MFVSPNHRREVIGLLDLGSSKISCIIIERSTPARPGSLPACQVLGHSQIQSDGIRAGMLLDMDRAETAVRQAIGLAEDQADVMLDDIVVGVSNGCLASMHFSASVELAEHHVQRHDLRRLAQSAKQYVEQQQRTLLYLNHVHYALDRTAIASQPLGLQGQQLDCQYHAVTTDAATLLAYEAILGRCGLSIRSMVPSGLASALAVTTEDERRQGVVCIDIGAGVVNLAVIHEGTFLHIDTLAFGGANLTHDVSAILNTPLADAERIKTLYGTIVTAPSDQSITIEYRQSGSPLDRALPAGTVEVHTTSRSELSRILYPRTVRQLELIGERLEQSEVTRQFAKSIVLTGGGSQLVGLSALAGRVFSKPVRIGQPELIDGLDKNYTNAAASTVLGLGLAETLAPTAVQPQIGNRIAYESYLQRMEQWLRESF